MTVPEGYVIIKIKPGEEMEEVSASETASRKVSDSKSIQMSANPMAISESHENIP